MTRLQTAHDELDFRTSSKSFDLRVHKEFSRSTPASFTSNGSKLPFFTNGGCKDTSSMPELEDSPSPLGTEWKKSNDVGKVIEGRTDGPRCQTNGPVEPRNRLSSNTSVAKVKTIGVSITKDCGTNTDDAPGRTNNEHPGSGLAPYLHVLLGLIQQVGLPPEVPPSVPQPEQEADSLKEIREQMKLAHRPDNKHIRTLVKCLVSEAHETPARHRTEVQKVLLSEWRRPCSPVRPSSEIRLEAPPPAFYVDASSIGIGFVFRNQWQAWELKDGWTGENRDNNWAEAAAVELGVRLMIQAGYSGRHLLLRCDNAGIVNDVSRWSFNDSPIGSIIKHIYHLCQQHSIYLEPKWIAGEHNPADNPSRLRTAKGSQRFPHSIVIPDHLRDFVRPHFR